MKNFAIKYPLTAGFIVFLAVLVGGTITGIIVYFVLFTGVISGKPPGDKHGVNIVIPIIFFLASLVLGAIAGLSTFVAFADSEQEKTYK